MIRRTAVTVVGLLMAFSSQAAGQSGLERVEELARLGRAEEARTALMGWWERDQETASRRELQRALWLRGRLTVDPLQAQLDFERLVVLYPSGQFTPDAILRLAQSAYAVGDDGASRRYVATLTRDYPRSDARARADAWLADAGPVPPRGDTPTRATDRGEPPAESATPTPARIIRPADDPPVTAADRDPPSRAENDRQRATAEAAAAPGTVMNYYVQLGAFADEERAFAVHDDVREAGIDVRVVNVEGSRFTHVRVGRFAQREAAARLLDELTAQGITAALVRDDRAERPIR